MKVVSKYLNKILPAIERFAFPLALCLLFVIYMIIQIESSVDTRASQVLVLTILSTGAVLSTATTLWVENWSNRLKAVSIKLLILCLWTGLISLWRLAGGLLQPDDIFQIVPGAVVFVLVAFLSLPFLKRKHDMAMWNFSIHAFIAFIGAYVISAILMLGIFLLMGFISKLFPVNISTKLYMEIATVIMGFLAPLLLFTILPSKDEKYRDKPIKMNRFFYSSIYYLFIPLLGLYVLTLYIYLLRIIVRWQLPDGMVSSLVIASMIGMTLILWLIYPVQYQEESRLSRNIRFVLPYLMVPLLILMTVAVSRRIGDYGLTAPRLYVLVFNIWSYFVCFILIKNKGKRLSFIPISFAFTALVLTVGPQNADLQIRRSMFRGLIKDVQRSGYKKLPLKDADFKAYMLMKKKEGSAEKVLSQLQYINNGFDAKRNPARIILSKKALAAMNDISISNKGQAPISEAFTFSFSSLDSFNLIQGYRTAVNSAFAMIGSSSDKELKIDVTYRSLDGIENTETFEIDLSRLRKDIRACKAERRPLLLVNGNAAAYFFSINYNPTENLGTGSCLLLLKK